LPTPQLQIIPRDQHNISRKQLSKAALHVLYGLKDAGYKALLVGGCVRDLLLGHQPKDYDIATDATPEDVHAVFRRSRIIGRRFKIVHVRYGPEIIEVSTFRGHHSSGNTRHDKHTAATSDNGMLLRDNVYGSIEEDAIRRDFTVNSLFYDIDNFSIYDYTNGLADVKAGMLRIIGNPTERFQEDPVRMLRAIRFAAKLDFHLEDQMAQLIAGHAELLDAIPAARLFDEVLKLFMTGNALATWHLLIEYQLFGALFPATNACLEDMQPFTETLLSEALRNTDQRIKEGKPVTPAYLFAALLWPTLQKETEALKNQGLPPVPALHEAAQMVTSAQIQRTALPRRFSTPMKQIWELQNRLLRNPNRQRDKLMALPRFRAAYDFILLREQSGENLNGMGQWWTDIQEGKEVPAPKSNTSKPRRRRPSRRRRPASQNG
jgi:poly(A) polymerase